MPDPPPTPASSDSGTAPPAGTPPPVALVDNVVPLAAPPGVDATAKSDSSPDGTATTEAPVTPDNTVIDPSLAPAPATDQTES